MTRSNALGDYLRARRELVDPADAGPARHGRPADAGLRREEVATLAGISADYYLRLEQGRDRNPSPQVLEALARVFGLDATATHYLLSLSAARPTAQKRPDASRCRRASGSLLDVLELPAFVESRLFDVLAANRLATALSPHPAGGEPPAFGVPRPGRAGPAPRLGAGDRRHGRGLPRLARTDVDDPRIAQLVGELSLASERFRQLWARHDVKPLAGAPTRMHHPQVGMLELRREKLAIGDSGGQLLVIYHAEPGSDSARSLALLGSLAATDAAADQPRPGRGRGG